ncbi:universal stress protein [Roseomonas sp. GC11]|uniref:universal stress protein n=1 Tax=Roseomonas sp. GC11 TaxID=2950546 RepID=UPI00210D9899|nr:universal stress protein [Roseomonas sp. GC11]MCQ4158477.1 universal stress protein [Roseomonas sp. GC11]
MLRSILLALDDTPGAATARDVAIALARCSGARLTAASVLDLPHTRDAVEAVPPGASAFLERRNEALARRAEEEAGAALAAFIAAAGDLPFATLRLEDAPEPALQKAGARHDLLVIGRDSTLGQEANEDGLAPVIEHLLHRGARPLLVVPPRAEMADHDPDGPVLVGYDGSLPAMRALQLFALLRPAGEAPVTVFTSDEDRPHAQALAGEAAEYLRGHGLAATPLGVAGERPADLLLAEAASARPRLVVMGAYETSGLRSFLLGSATRKLLRELACPVFVHR